MRIFAFTKQSAFPIVVHSCNHLLLQRKDIVTGFKRDSFIMLGYLRLALLAVTFNFVHPSSLPSIRGKMLRNMSILKVKIELFICYYNSLSKCDFQKYVHIQRYLSEICRDCKCD